ncbi:MAG: phage terminase large subunit [Bacteroidota bacterium]
MPKFKYSTTFKKIAKLRKPIRVIQGGKGSSKTISTLQYLILLCLSKRENLIISVVAKSLPNLKSGALRDFEKILRDMGVYSQFKINRTDRVYQYGSNIIEFFSVDGDSDRLGSRRTHLYVNEVDNIKLDTFIEIQGRTSEFTIVDFNPRKIFWIHEDFVGQDNTDFIIVNFNDNEYIPEGELEAIMFYKKRADETGSPYWINKWRVLGLGETGVIDGVIFEEGKDWHIVDIVPEGARYLGAGLDFGFTHVSAIMKLYELVIYDDNGNELKREYYLKQALFRAGMTAQRIAEHILSDSELMSSIITCDSSRPEMIREMRGLGCPVVSHKKREVMEGIDLMHTLGFFLIAGDEETIDEFRSYAYAKDRTGKSLGVPDKRSDVDNSIDAARYVIEYFLAKSRNRKNILKWIA